MFDSLGVKLGLGMWLSSSMLEALGSSEAPHTYTYKIKGQAGIQAVALGHWVLDLAKVNSSQNWSPPLSQSEHSNILVTSFLFPSVCLFLSYQCLVPAAGGCWSSLDQCSGFLPLTT